MRIDALRRRRLVVPLDPPFVAAWDPVPRTEVEVTLVEVHADGLVGRATGDALHGLDGLAPLLLGEDAGDLDRLGRVSEQWTFHHDRSHPVEAALWELAALAQGSAVSELVGGTADRLPAYASTGELKDRGARVEAAVAAVEHGFRAIKLRVSPRDAATGMDGVAAVRAAVGGEVELMVDLNQGWRMPGDTREPVGLASVQAIAERAADLGLRWLEEPLPNADLDGHRRLRELGLVPVAAGEMLRSYDDAIRLLDVVDVIQCDVLLSCGVGRIRRLAVAATESGRHFTPHTWSVGMGVLINLHVAAGVGAGPFLELPFDPPGWTPRRRDVPLAAPLDIDRAGDLLVPPGAGWGADLDVEAIERFCVDDVWFRA